MKANLFLHKEYFRYNGVDTLEEAVQKWKQFAEDIRDILFSSDSETVFTIQKGFSEVQVYQTSTILEFVCANFPNDECAVIFSLFANESEELSDLSLDELTGLCVYSPDEEQVNSLLVLNRKVDSSRVVATVPYISFDRYEIVYNKQSWIHLRRQILGNHPGTRQEFVSSCSYLFSKILFSKDCCESLIDKKYDYLATSSRKIVYYLSCLNDCFECVLKEHQKTDESTNTVLAVDANSILEDFSGRYRLDAPGSIERNASKKKNLKFNFCINQEGGNTCDFCVVCEPHLKITSADNGSHQSDPKFNPRIYFVYELPHDIPCPDGIKYLVGAMGAHLG